jgi:proteasome lid subunit RPN8/RPN11
MPRHPKLKREDIQIGELYKYVQYPYHLVMVHGYNQDTVKYENLTNYDGSNSKTYAAMIHSFLAFYRKAY